jgi:chromosome segregation ATPase
MAKKDAGKGAAAAAAAAGPDPAVLLAQAQKAWTLTGSSFGDSMSGLTNDLRRITEENVSLKKQMAAVEARSAETFAHNTAKIDSLTDSLQKAGIREKALEARLARVPLELKAAADAAKAVMQTEVDELARKLREREAALERLADFRRERDDLIAELRSTREDLEKEQQAHQNDIAALERRNIRDR